MFSAAARKKAHSPAARRKATRTLQRTIARRKREEQAAAAGRTAFFNISDLPKNRPPKVLTRRYNSAAAKAHIQFAREVVSLISRILDTGK